jgi:HEAT repeat protein
VKELLALAAPGKSKWVRTVALRHLSAIGGDTVVPPAAKILREPELQEEAAFCLERIPGSASDAALMAALSDAKDDFKPRILAALGHRRVAAAAPLCAKAMASPNAGIAVAAMKALARIGRNPGVEMVPPNVESLAGFQQVEFADSMLRYADGMVESGRMAEALGLYKQALDRPEEHLQCAAIIGLGKTRSEQTAALIGPKRSSGQRNVRITAEKVWAAMAPRPKA